MLDGKKADPHGEPTRANIVCLSPSSCQPSRNHGAQLREIRRMTGKAQPGACHRPSERSNDANSSTGDTLLLHCESLSPLQQLRLIAVQTQDMARSSRGALRMEPSAEDTTNVRFDRAQSLSTMLNEASSDIVPSDALNPEDKEKIIRDDVRLTSPPILPRLIALASSPRFFIVSSQIPCPRDAGSS